MDRPTAAERIAERNAAAAARQEAEQKEKSERHSRAGKLGRAVQMAAEAKRQKRLERGMELDRLLAEELKQLRKTAETLKVVPGTKDERIDWDTWFGYIENIIRSCTHWDLDYPPYPPTEEFEDQPGSYSERTFCVGYPDAMANDIGWTYIEFSNPEFKTILARALDGFLQWVDRHPEADLDHVSEIKTSLNKLKQTGTLFEPEAAERLRVREQERVEREKKEAEELAEVLAKSRLQNQNCNDNDFIVSGSERTGFYAPLKPTAAAATPVLIDSSLPVLEGR